MSLSGFADRRLTPVTRSERIIQSGRFSAELKPHTSKNDYAALSTQEVRPRIKRLKKIKDLPIQRK